MLFDHPSPPIEYGMLAPVLGLPERGELEGKTQPPNNHTDHPAVHKSGRAPYSLRVTHQSSLGVKPMPVAHKTAFTRCTKSLAFTGLVRNSSAPESKPFRRSCTRVAIL